MKKFACLLAFVFAVGTTQTFAATLSDSFAVECEKCGDKSKKCDSKAEGKKACCAKKAENAKACAAKTDAEKAKCHSKAEVKAEAKPAESTLEEKK